MIQLLECVTTSNDTIHLAMIQMVSDKVVKQRAGNGDRVTDHDEDEMLIE